VLPKIKSLYPAHQQSGEAEYRFSGVCRDVYPWVCVSARAKTERLQSDQKLMYLDRNMFNHRSDQFLVTFDLDL